jgi:hypothetical protein
MCIKRIFPSRNIAEVLSPGGRGTILEVHLAHSLRGVKCFHSITLWLLNACRFDLVNVKRDWQRLELTLDVYQRSFLNLFFAETNPDFFDVLWIVKLPFVFV